jgi:hypothetical protein
MERSILANLGLAELRHSPHRLKMVVMYEDSSTQARAEGFLEKLTGGPEGSAVLEKQMWLVCELRSLGLRKIAAEESGAADIVVLSLHDSDELSPELKQWARLWLERCAGQPPRLVALLDAATGAPGAGWETLLAAVREKGGAGGVLRYDIAPESS